MSDTTAVPLTVTLAVRWETDKDGDQLLYAGPLGLGCVYSMGHDPVWWHAAGAGLCHGIRIRNLPTQAEAMAALQAAALKELRQ